MVLILSKVAMRSTGGDTAPVDPDDLVARIADQQKRYTGRIFALRTFLARTPAGREIRHTVEEPLIARATVPDAPPVRWLANGVCEHVFPVTALAPHPAVEDAMSLYGLGQALDRHGYLVGDAPRLAPRLVRLRRLFP